MEEYGKRYVFDILHEKSHYHSNIIKAIRELWKTEIYAGGDADKIILCVKRNKKSVLECTSKSFSYYDTPFGLVI